MTQNPDEPLAPVTPLTPVPTSTPAPVPAPTPTSAPTDEVTNHVDKEQIAQFVTTIRNAEEQVGQHIIRALQHDDTVAVITTVAMGPDGNQRVISAALSPERLQQVQEILQSAQSERLSEDPCVGFHCLIQPREKTGDQAE